MMEDDNAMGFLRDFFAPEAPAQVSVQVQGGQQYAVPNPMDYRFAHAQPQLVMPTEQDLQQGQSWQQHIQPQNMLPPAAAFDYGRSGVTGDGMISFKDHAQIAAAEAKALYEAAYAKAQRGEFPMGWQLENMRAAADLAANDAATGQSRSMFTRPQFLPQWEQYNEQLHELQAMGGNLDLESLLPSSLRGQNTGARWRGFEATPIGTSFGGGDGGGDSWGMASGYDGPATSNFTKGSSFEGGGYNPTLGTHTPGVSAFGNPYNNGNLSSASDQGSYKSPLLASGGYTSPGIGPGEPYAPDTGGLQPLPNPQYMDPRFQDPSGWTRGNAPGFQMPGFDPSSSPLHPKDIYGRPITEQEMEFRQRQQQPVTEQDLQNQRVSQWGEPVTLGAETLPLHYAEMEDVGMSSSKKKAASPKKEVLPPRELSSFFQDIYYSQPVATRAALMAKNQGIFGD